MISYDGTNATPLTDEELAAVWEKERQQAEQKERLLLARIEAQRKGREDARKQVEKEKAEADRQKKAMIAKKTAAIEQRLKAFLPTAYRLKLWKKERVYIDVATGSRERSQIVYYFVGDRYNKTGTIEGDSNGSQIVLDGLSEVQRVELKRFLEEVCKKWNTLDLDLRMETK